MGRENGIAGGMRRMERAGTRAEGTGTLRGLLSLVLSGAIRRKPG